MEPCNCGSGFVGCLNDDCPVQPLLEEGDEPVGTLDRHAWRLKAWNTRATITS